MNSTHKPPPALCGFFEIFRCALLGTILFLIPGSAPALDVVHDTTNASNQNYRLPEDPNELLKFDNEMRAFFATRIHRGLLLENFLDEIESAIHSEDGLHFQYESDGVYDVREAFRRRRGNCLTYSMLVVAIAREFGINAKFNEVSIYPRWYRTGRIVLLTGHINVRVEAAFDSYEIDIKLNDNLRTGRSSAHVIDDARAFAEVYGNVGVYKLAAGDAQNALRLMEKATTVDPTSAPAWANLGTALTHVGQLERAQKYYERALAIEPNLPAALSGLASLHRKNGRIAEAEKLERKILRYRERNPYYLLSKARDELSDGNFTSARSHLKRAINIKDDEPELYELMSEVARKQGLDKEAKRWIEKSKRVAS